MPTSDGDKLVTMSQLKRYVESVIGGGGGGTSSGTVIYDPPSPQESAAFTTDPTMFSYLEIESESGTYYVRNPTIGTNSVYTSPTGGNQASGVLCSIQQTSRMYGLALANRYNYSPIELTKITGYTN